MKYNFRTSQIPCLEYAVSEVRNAEQTQELRLGDGLPDVGRILGAWGQLTIRGKEWHSDCIQISGGVTAWILYAPEDGSQPVTQNVWIPFQMKWELPENAPEGTILVHPLIRFVDARSVSARKIMVRVGIGVLCCAAVRAERTVYAPDSLPEGTQLLKSTYPVRLMQEAGEKSFQIEDTVGNGLSSDGKLVYCQLRPVITEQKVLTNKIAFRGSGNLHVLMEEEDGSLRAFDYPLTFSQFVDLDGSYSSDALSTIHLAVTNLETEQDEEGHLNVKAGMIAQFILDDRMMVETVEDAYFPGKEMETARMELLLPSILERKTENIISEQTVPGKGTQIADASFQPDFPRMYLEQGGVTMEAPGTVQLLYYGEDGRLRSLSARWEGKQTLDVDTTVKMMAVPAAILEPHVSFDTDSVGLRVELPVSMSSMGGNGIPMLTGLEIEDSNVQNINRPSLILCRAGRDGLWSVAKQCGSTVDLIRKANHLEADAQPGQMLLIPVT